jgi:extradiol dioxygenase family protein
MKIEHFAYQVEDPAAVAEWYCRQLGFIVKRESDSPVPVRFLADETGEVMIEYYNNPVDTTPD